jgi:photosystem II stability/assembly factor-like uncharacterized protein
MAAGSQDGVYVSLDGGETWTGISSLGSAAPRPVVSLAFDATNSNILYAGTPHLAWKTTDRGRVWRRIHKGMEPDSDIFSIAVDRTRSKRLFAGACSGIYRSLDGGRTWSNLAQAAGAQLRTYVIVQAPRNADEVFAGTNTGLLRSSDGGATWQRLASWQARSIAFDPDDPHRMFVATDHGILRSDDGGRNFREANQGLHCRYQLTPRRNLLWQDLTAIKNLRPFERPTLRAREHCLTLAPEGILHDYLPCYNLRFFIACVLATLLQCKNGTPR